MKKLVIIGGGFAGAYSAKYLEDNFDVHLIDTKDYFEFTPGILRAIVEPNHVKKVQILHSDYLKKTKIYRALVDNIDNKYVYFGKNKINYDYLIIASGSRYNEPFKAENIVTATRADKLKDCHKNLEKAKDILIIGGGIVGVELTAEIANHYSNKKITLIHSGDCLIERNNKRARNYAEKFLRKKKINLVFNEFVNIAKSNIFVTDKKTKIRTDLAFLCTGIVPNSSFMKKFFKDKLTRDFINVNSFLQLDGFNNIFVIGDVSGVNEEKTAQAAESHATLVVKNIKSLEHSKKLEKYVNKSRIMIISLGKYDGILTYKNFTLTGLIPGLLKQFVEWKTMKRYKF